MSGMRSGVLSGMRSGVLRGKRSGVRTVEWYVGGEIFHFFTVELPTYD